MTQAGPPGPKLPSDLGRKRGLARAILWFEQLWPAVWPALGLVGAFAAAALLDLPAFLPPSLRVALPAVVLLAAAALLWRGLGHTVRPSPDSVDRRLERATGLSHRPLAALQDQAATRSPEGERVWALHQQRLRAQIGRLRVGTPRPGLAGRDRIALRMLLGVALVATLVMAGPDWFNRLAAATWPALPSGPAAPGTVVQAWVTPPAYTGLPPLFLQPGTTPAPVPTGAHLTVSVTGGSGNPTLALGAEPTEFHALDGSSWQAERDITASGRLAVRRGPLEVAGWSIAVLPDKPPTAAFTETPGAVGGGGRAAARVRLPWQADDDYGVAAVQGELRLRDRPDAPPLVVAGALSGSPKSVRGTILQDLTAHPWAGLPVRGRVAAKDAAGQRGESKDAEFALPERSFANPAAQALIAIRKQLSLTPDARQQARMALEELGARPELFDNSASVALQLRGAGALLLRGHGQPAVDEAQARMWALALALEEGATDRTAQALAQARQAVRDAMDAARQNPEDKAAHAELDKRMEELREAIQKHLEALAEQARRERTEMPLDPNQPQMNARDLDRMAQRAEEAAREGRMDDAKQQMAELEKLLEQLQNARPEHGEQREKRNAERREKGKQQMDAVQDMVQREGGLLDRSRSRTDQPSPSPNGQTGASPPPRPPSRPDARPPGSANATNPDQPGQDQRGKDQRAQNAMRRALGELMQRFGDLTGQVPAPLGEADTAMRDAGQAMAEGRDNAAGAAQQRAIEALQKGGRSMSQQLARQFGRGEQEGEGEGEGDEGQEASEGDQGQAGQGDNANGNRDGQSGQRPGEAQRRRSARRDPLGRQLPQDVDGREQGVDGAGLGSQPVPTEMEQARTRALQDELRRRGADRTRPQPELDYIDRLLKSF